MPNAILNVGQTGGQINISTAAAPATPAVGVVTLYAGTDKALHALNSDGTDITLTIGATGATGSAGAIGATGSAGATGATGSTVISYDVPTTSYATCTGNISATCPNSNNVIIGDANFFINGPTAGRSNYVGIGSCLTSWFLAAYSPSFGIAVGRCLQTNPGGINIGCCNVASENISIGTNNFSQNGGHAIGKTNSSNGASVIGNNGTSGFCSIVVGNNNFNAACSVALGFCNVNSTGNCSIGIGVRTSSCASDTISIGTCARSFQGATGTIVLGSSSVGGTGACNSVVIGNSSRATACNSGVLGQSSCSVNTGAYVIGNSIVSEKTDTVHVNSLIAFGQAASKTNAVGSTGGSVTLDWDNSNIQTVTLTSSITTLTKSNPIDGAVYTLFLTQGASGGYTVAWGADVEWAGGTGPTLSTAAGAVDAVSLVYIAGVTGYYGNANLNFS